MRDLAVAEESDERKFTEPVADDPELGGAAPEHVLAPAEAGEVEPALRRPVELAADGLEHPHEVVARRGAVASAEENRHPVLDRGADRDQLVLRIDAHEVAHEVITGVGARYRQRHVDALGRTCEIASSDATGVLPQDIERRAAVERHADVALAFGNNVPRGCRAGAMPERRAALREPRRNPDTGGEHHAGRPPCSTSFATWKVCARGLDRPPTR